MPYIARHLPSGNYLYHREFDAYLVEDPKEAVERDTKEGLKKELNSYLGYLQDNDITKFLDIWEIVEIFY
jgi:hypothetical protein